MEDRKFICPCYRHRQDIAADGRCICGLFVSPDYRPPARLEAPPIRRDDTPWPPITVYGAVWCRDTIRTRTFLNAHGIPYEIIDVDEDQAAADKVMVWNDGELPTPTLDIGGRIVVSPSDEALAEILGVGMQSPEAT